MVEAGGSQWIVGGSGTAATATDTTIQNGGVQSAGLLGTATDATIQSGGEQVIGSGGTAIDTMVSNGGTAKILTGGLLEDRPAARPDRARLISRARSATLQINATPAGAASFGATLENFGVGDRLDLVGMAAETGATATMSGGVLTVTSGETSESFKLSGSSARASPSRRTARAA